MESVLPFLISIPHGGREVPACVADHVALTERGILEDGDAFTGDIYDLRGRVTEVIRADVARAVVDLNRAMTDRPPEHPDGVIKNVTCYNKPVYRPGRFPDQALIEKLLREYYRPYHDRIRSALGRGDIAVALDCHSMAEHAPPTAADPGRPRPLICLGNHHGRSCSMAWTEALADCFGEVFGLRDRDVALNEPFSGGFITQTHGAGPIPWIQIEINRSLYLRPPWYDPAGLAISSDRLEHLQAQFGRVLGRFHEEIAC